jgi:hypothetical protein
VEALVTKARTTRRRCPNRAFGGRLVEGTRGPGPESPVRKARPDSEWFDDDRICRARGGWIGEARAKMEKKGTVGALHRQLGVSEGSKIPTSKLSAAKARAKRTGNTKLMRRITFAENARG